MAEIREQYTVDPDYYAQVIASPNHRTQKIEAVAYPHHVPGIYSLYVPNTPNIDRVAIHHGTIDAFKQQAIERTFSFSKEAPVVVLGRDRYKRRIKATFIFTEESIDSNPDLPPAA